MRHAILIESSNVKGQNRIPGAALDVNNWKAFLNSDLGGAWSNSEITTLSHPDESTVDRVLREKAGQYCFVTFSGHGANESVVLNEKCTNFPLNRLRPKSTRGTLIVDACRGVEAIATTKLVFAENSAFNASRSQRSNAGFHVNFSGSVSLHQALWFNALDNLQNGIVEMLACAKGQAAGEDPDEGGYYSLLLVDSAKTWEPKALRNSIHSTKDAHNYAYARLNSKQTPEYRPLDLAFPFAVKA